MIISILAVLFTFGLVIFLHEFGHFIVCKLVGIRVDAFSFGFGKELLGFTRGDTRYSLRLIPLGGYVKPAGEEIEEEAPAAPEEPAGQPPSATTEAAAPPAEKEAALAPYMYFAKPWYARFAVVLAGPVMNYLLAFALFSGVILLVGEPRPSKAPVLGDVSQGYPADLAGLKAGDKIVKVDGVTTDSWGAMAGAIYAKVEKEISVTYERAGAAATVKLKTRKSPEGAERGVIGISPAVEYAPVPLLKGLRMGAHQCWYWTNFTVQTLKSNIIKREKPDLAGPIGIVNIVSKAAHTGKADFFFLIGLISVAVGFFNLLPIPLLDGGWMILYLFEGVSRRKLTGNMMKYVNAAGMVMLLSILVFATYNDIMRIVASRAAKQAAAEQVQPK
ncbi:MAG: M50 family metallopeptidase [Elusimicrobiales bacterium]|nr:M50 family metallopeptidase [Elusimicrobiales bacterium]